MLRYTYTQAYDSARLVATLVSTLVGTFTGAVSIPMGSTVGLHALTLTPIAM